MCESYFYFHYPFKNGNYEFCLLDNMSSTDPYESECVKSYDLVLHRTLSEIFRERSSLSSSQIKELLRATDDNPILDLILEKEPSLNRIFPEDHEIPLLWISVLGYFHSSTELLVRLGVDVNELCEIPICEYDFDENMNILSMLIVMYPSSRNERLIDLVINHGADLRSQDTFGETALYHTAFQGRVQVAKWLLEKKTAIECINAFDVVKKTALLTTADTDKAGEMIPLLIEHGADVTSIDQNGQNVMHHLSLAPGKHVELAKLLIKKGASVVHSSETQAQPLHKAALAENNDFVKLFLDHGADVNYANGNNYNFPLYLAATNRDPSVLLTLLKHGANIDQKTHTTGSTALHTACSRQNVEMIKILLSVGADMFVEDSRGLRPLAFVNYHYEENVRPILRTLAIKRTTHLKPQIELKHERHIKENYPKSWNYYMNCIAEIERMKSTRFIPTCTFFDLLEKCQCEVSELMRNRDFEREFWLYDILEVFPVFAEDLEKAFERAERYYNSALQQENEIDDALQNAWPQIVVRKIARYTLNCEICEMKNTVSASRRSVQQASNKGQ